MEQLDIFSYLEEKVEDAIDIDRFQCTFNKIVDFKLEEKKFFKDYTIIEIDPKGVKDKYSFSYKEIFDKDYNFYRDNLLSVEVDRNNVGLLLFKNTGYDLLKKVKDDCRLKDKLIFKKWEEVTKLREHNFLNLLLKSITKLENQNVDFVNSSYKLVKYIEKIYVDKGKNNQRDRIEVGFKGFTPYFYYTYYNEKDEYDVYVDYEIRSYIDMDNIIDDKFKERNQYNKYALYRNDNEIFPASTSIRSKGKMYLQKEKNKHNRATMKELLLYQKSESKTASEEQLKTKLFELVADGSKQTLIYKYLFLIEKYYKEYVSFSLYTLKNKDYKNIIYKKSEKGGKNKSTNNYGWMKEKEYDSVIKKQLFNKKLAIIDNFGSPYSKFILEIIRDTIIKEDLFINIDVFNSIDEFNMSDYNYTLNFVGDPEIYKKNTLLKDPYIEHDFKNVVKNMIIKSIPDEEEKFKDENWVKKTRKDLNTQIKGQIKGILLSFIVEEDLIRGKSDLLKLSNYKPTSFIIHKNTKDNKYLYKLNIEDGKIDLECNSFKGKNKINELRLNLKEETRFLKIKLDLEMADKGYCAYDEEMLIYEGKSKNILLRTQLKPMISKEMAEEFIDKDKFAKNIKGDPDFDEKKPTFGFKDLKDSSRIYMNTRSESFYDYMYYSYIDCKIIDDYYISGYKGVGINMSFKSSPVARRVVGDNYKELIQKFTDELFCSYKSVSDTFTVRPLAYKYLMTIKDICENNRVNVEEEI